jgi:RimJ/RimL family protein N-acetyltransferase
MSDVVIRTDRLNLVLEQPAEVVARIEAMSPADRAQVSPTWLARVHAATAADPWLHGFSIIDRATGAVVGSCGFKGPPEADGIVELAYGIHPEHRGRGYATESAVALAEFAFAGGIVRVVHAHTQPGNAASERVLAKAGFACVGEVIDPEDGLVWRWERRKGQT